MEVDLAGKPENCMDSAPEMMPQQMTSVGPLPMPPAVMTLAQCCRGREGGGATSYKVPDLRQKDCLCNGPWRMLHWHRAVGAGDGGRQPHAMPLMMGGESAMLSQSHTSADAFQKESILIELT